MLNLPFWTYIAIAVALLLLLWPRRGAGAGTNGREPWQRLDAIPVRLVEALYTAVSWPYLVMIALTVNYLLRETSLSQVAMIASWANVFVRRSTPVALQAFGRNEVTGPGVPPRAETEEIIIGHEPGEDEPAADPTQA